MHKVVASFLSCTGLLTLSLLPAEAQIQTLPANKIQRGMQGECHTVFQGKEIEPFPFEVIDIMHGTIGPKLDLILARLQGEKATYTGVVAGMSGSPCYIEGRLIGALSYRFGSFTKEPIAGITPIESMLRIFDIPERPAAPHQQVYQPTDYQTVLNNKPQAISYSGPQGNGQLQAIATPLNFSGFDPAIINAYKADLQALGFQPVMGSSGGSQGNSDAPQKLEMGGAIAGQMVRGDVSISGTGTVSYIDGNRVLAFGHPFFNSGHVQIPMATAWIQHILVTEMGSFKMAEDGVEVGTITQDRATAIAGYLGQKTRMIPVHLQIEEPNQVDPSELNFEVFQDPGYTPLMMAMSVNNALQSRLKYNLGGNLNMEGTLTVDGQKIPFKRFYSSTEQSGTPMMAAKDLANTLFQLWNNPFQQPSIQGLNLKFTLRDQSQIAQIDDVWPDRTEVQAGESVSLNIRLKTYRGENLTRHLRVQVPPDSLQGPLLLLVSDGPNLDALENSLKSGYFNYKDLLRNLSQSRESDRIYLKWIAEEPGLAQYGQIYTQLPASLTEILDNPANFSHSVPLIRSPGTEYSQATEYDLNGQKFINFLVSSQGRTLN